MRMKLEPGDQYIIILNKTTVVLEAIFLIGSKMIYVTVETVDNMDR